MEVEENLVCERRERMCRGVWCRGNGVGKVRKCRATQGMEVLEVLMKNDAARRGVAIVVVALWAVVRCSYCSWICQGFPGFRILVRHFDQLHLDHSVSRPYRFHTY